ncbi:MAG TPA: hypothetical protein VNH13_03695 [Candidatus Acidoferrales bacterium]|nr:hypothetical protein [Candidatus Acidoferrales bacterium]
MSKRHQSTRRRTYGRRQHELHERSDRQIDRGRLDMTWDDRLDGIEIDPLAFLDPRTLRLRYGFGD